MYYVICNTQYARGKSISISILYFVRGKRQEARGKRSCTSQKCCITKCKCKCYSLKNVEVVKSITLDFLKVKLKEQQATSNRQRTKDKGQRVIGKGQKASGYRITMLID